jgi:hypothetical protein
MVNIMIGDNHPDGEGRLAQRMMKFEREMVKKGLRPRMPCDEPTAASRLEARLMADYEKMGTKLRRIEAWQAILAVIRDGELVTIRTVMDELATGANESGWITREAAASYLSQMALGGYLAALPRKGVGLPTQYVRLAKDYVPDIVQLVEV